MEVHTEIPLEIAREQTFLKNFHSLNWTKMTMTYYDRVWDPCTFSLKHTYIIPNRTVTNNLITRFPRYFKTYLRHLHIPGSSRIPLANYEFGSEMFSLNTMFNREI